ncbi:hypothetical protein LCGC14_2818430, partial [marine sediment metagenome]
MGRRLGPRFHVQRPEFSRSGAFPNENAGGRMKGIMKILIPVGLSAAGFFLGMSSVDRGIDRETVSNLLRAAGDSAVTEFRSGDDMAEFISESLADTVAFYDAEVRAATKIVIRRDTIRIVGERIVVGRPADATLEDTVVVPLPLIRQNGITVAESLT